MKYSEIKEVKEFCDSLSSEPDWRKVVDNIVNGEADFTIDNVRFINEKSIDEIQQEELESDLYCLGCFRPGFLSMVINIDEDVIKAMQDAEAFEAIGKLIISLDKLEELQKEYSRLDSYGHHFNYHDGSEQEFYLDEKRYYVFDNQ